MPARKNPKSLWGPIQPVTYCIYAGLIGTQSVLFSKCLSTLLRETFNGDNQFSSWFIWVVIPMFLVTAVFWVTRLNQVWGGGRAGLGGRANYLNQKGLAGWLVGFKMP